MEIDILAVKEKESRIIEVKSIKKEEHLGGLLKEKQKERLKKAAQSLCDDRLEGLRAFFSCRGFSKQDKFF